MVNKLDSSKEVRPVLSERLCGLSPIDIILSKSYCVAINQSLEKCDRNELLMLCRILIH